MMETGSTLAGASGYGVAIPRYLTGLRDRAIVAVLIYTAAHIGAVAGLTVAGFSHDGSQCVLTFLEKGALSPARFQENPGFPTACPRRQIR